MNLESGQSYMDKLKAKNIPQALIENAPAERIQMVQISAEDWDELMVAVKHMEALNADLTAQRATLSAEASKYAEAMARAAQEHTQTAEATIKRIASEASEQVGRASAKASAVIDRNALRDEALWWLRLILTAAPMILVLLLWARVGLGI